MKAPVNRVHGTNFGTTDLATKVERPASVPPQLTLGFRLLSSSPAHGHSDF